MFDTVTKLIWQEESPDKTYTWSEAKDYCQQQNIEKLGGYSSGWHLPGVSELLTIIDYRIFNPSFDQHAFPGPINRYWTSTPKHGDPGSAWLVNFTIGESTWSSQTSNYCVRCVR